MRKWLTTLSFCLTLLSPVVSFTATANVALDANSISPILPGQTLPAFSAKNALGKTVTFKQGELDKPSIFIFYRGGWCPFCNMYWDQLVKYEKQLKALNMDIYFVSSDSVASIAESLDEGKKHYELLSDGDGKVAQAFGVAFKVDDATVKRYLEWNIDLEKTSGSESHILPAPAAFIVDSTGKVKFSFVNPDYQVRLHPEVLISAAKHQMDNKFEFKK